MNPEMYQELVRQISSLQRQVDGLIKPEVGRWIDWTPSIDQGGGVARNIDVARYTVFSNTVCLFARMTITGAGVAGNDIIIAGLPVLSAYTGLTLIIGSGLIYDNGTALYSCSVSAYQPGEFRLYGFNVVGGLGTSPSFALANTDEVGFQAVYERT